ncbi:MAG: hypothetical protein U0821_23955 [Chloroflexota bacterium]
MLRWLAVGIGAGFVAKSATEQVAADNGNNVIAGQAVTATNVTQITGTVGGLPALRVLNGTGSAPDNLADAIQGVAAGAYAAGIAGRNNDVNGIGASGTSPNGTGAYGESITGTGVGGRSTSGTGVYGSSGTGNGITGSSAGANGVAGVSTTGTGTYGGSTSGAGVYASSSSGSGVVAGSTTGIGVSSTAGGFAGVNSAGTSPSTHGLAASANGSGATPGHGVVGWQSGTGWGVWAVGATANAAGGIAAVATGASQYAGRFDGNVLVVGNFSVIGGTKNVLIEHPDGTHRRMYCQESPDPWFNDFGKGAPTSGRAVVTIDPDFAATIKTDDYGVIAVPEGDCNGLYVTAKTPASFEVRELKGGTSSVPFRYQIAARQKAATATRMEKVTLPPKPPSITVPEVKVPTIVVRAVLDDKPGAPPASGPIPAR